MQITIFSTQSCPYCVEAKEILEKTHLRYLVVDIEAHPSKREVLQSLIGDRKLTVPQIFFHNSLIGGCSELKELSASGRIAQRLQQAADWSSLRSELQHASHKNDGRSTPPPPVRNPGPREGYKEKPKEKEHKPQQGHGFRPDLGVGFGPDFKDAFKGNNNGPRPKDHGGAGGGGGGRKHGGGGGGHGGGGQQGGRGPPGGGAGGGGRPMGPPPGGMGGIGGMGGGMGGMGGRGQAPPRPAGG